jgi:hypothetical protein
MAPNRVVDVYEAFLEEGDRILFKLRYFGDDMDLKLHVFPGTPGGIYSAWDEHAISTPYTAVEEWLVYEAVETGWHPVVVCRSTGRTIESPIEYTLTWAPTEITDVEEPSDGPRQLVFLAPAPNPTSAGSRLGFELPRAGRVRIDLFDVRGHRIKTLVDHDFPAGRYHQDWSGRDQQNRLVAAGVYYARMQVGEQVLTRRLTVMR